MAQPSGDDDVDLAVVSREFWALEHCAAFIAMRVTIRATAITETKWHEYLVRFGFGGIITVIAGLIATKFGPVIGGFFLAFPAIFPASVTLVETHERRRKEKHGLSGRQRGRNAASIDAAGAAIGSVGLFAFGMMVWLGVPRFAPWIVLVSATIVWFVFAAVSWTIRKRL
jgi:uncharacterized protein DUF3147